MFLLTSLPFFVPEIQTGFLNELGRICNLASCICKFEIRKLSSAIKITLREGGCVKKQQTLYDFPPCDKGEFDYKCTI